MSYLALYRKFRPQTFSEVKGQDHIVRTLTNQIRNNRIGHAYLFTGTRGTGKTSVAKIFARAINCMSPEDGEPCNGCENCLASAQGTFMDIVEIDAASNTSVDDIRRIIDEVRYSPVKGRYKVYIIDEVHMLSGSAFNAFLKTLEEPPQYAVFILATTEPHKLPITILSRCQRYDFHRISNDEIKANLAEITAREGVEADEKATEYVARCGDGSMRDSISLLDKCIAFNLGERLTYENVLITLGEVDTEVFSRIFRSVYSGNVPGALRELEDAVREGKDLTQFVTDIIWYMRNLLLVKSGGQSSVELLGISEENMNVLKEDAESADIQILMRYIRILSEVIDNMRFSPSRQVLAEVALIKLARPEMETDRQSLADRIRQLEAGKVTFAAQPQPAPVPVRESTEVKAQAAEPVPDAFYGQEDYGEELYIPQEPEIWESQELPESSEGGHQAGARSSNAGVIKNSWNDIISAISSPMLRTSLKKSRVADEGEDFVLIACTAGFHLDTARENAAEIKNVILKVTGREVKVNVAEEGKTYSADKQNGSAGSEGAFPENLLKNINFEIGTEE